MTTTRADLLAHLDVLSDAGHPPVCWTVPMPERSVWTSEDPAEHVVAARLCRTCPAVTACAAYGLDHPKEAGVIGGLTEPERRCATKEKR